MEDDLQELYANKELKKDFKQVPLAQDAAHLLSEYLDTLAIEFVRQGVLEPYQITAQYEEIIVHELQRKGADHKLTYDTVNRVLESFGPPARLVKDYIKENKPKLKPLLITNVIQDTQLSGKGDVTVRKGLEMTFGYIVLFWVLVSNLITAGLYYINYYEVGKHEYYYSLWGGIIFIVYELYSGYSGRLNIDMTIYRKLRPFIKTSFTFVTIMALIPVLDGAESLTFRYGFYWLLALTIGVYFVTFLRDISPLFYSVNHRVEFKWVRFILPSYLVTYVVFGLGFSLVYFHRTQNLNYQVSSGPLIPFLMIGSILAILADDRRKYPASIHRILLLLTIPYMFLRATTYSYFDRVNFGHREEIIDDTVGSGVLLTSILSWLFFYIISTIRVFRFEIQGELAKLQQDL